MLGAAWRGLDLGGGDTHQVAALRPKTTMPHWPLFNHTTLFVHSSNRGLVARDLVARMQSACMRPASVGSCLSSKASIASVRPFQSTVCTTSRVVRSSAVTVENRVAIRFQRFGRKKAPFYRMVAIDSKDRREGKPIEYLGWYDPLKKETNLNAPAIKKWLSNGAQPSETVRNLLKKAYVIQPDVKPAAPATPSKK